MIYIFLEYNISYFSINLRVTNFRISFAVEYSIDPVQTHCAGSEEGLHCLHMSAIGVSCLERVTIFLWI